jgi:ribosomal protein S18 acetylase RimI-like enzyme
MSTIECGLFQSSDTAAVVHLLAGVFSAAEPPAVAMGLTAMDFERFVGLLCPKAAAEGLTIVARDLGSGQIAGVLLTDDFAVPPVLASGEVSDKFLPIFAMLDNLDDQYRQSRSIVAGQYLHLFMLAVDEHFAGRGIAQQLVTACLLNGRQKGYTHAVTEATGVVSQHLFRKLGFADRFRVSYQDYRYEGRALFASIRDHEAAILMDRAVK